MQRRPLVSKINRPTASRGAASLKSVTPKVLAVKSRGRSHAESFLRNICCVTLIGSGWLRKIDIAIARCQEAYRSVDLSRLCGRSSHVLKASMKVHGL